MLHNGMQPDSRNDRASGGEYARKIILSLQIVTDTQCILFINE